MPAIINEQKDSSLLLWKLQGNHIFSTSTYSVSSLSALWAIQSGNNKIESLLGYQKILKINIFSYILSSFSFKMFVTLFPKVRKFIDQYDLQETERHQPKNSVSESLIFELLRFHIHSCSSYQVKHPFPVQYYRVN